jgi:hypothetical protein
MPPSASRLYRQQAAQRRFILGFLWLIIMPASLWVLRQEMQLLWQYFTWTGLRYGLAFHPLAAMGLITTLGFTTASLLHYSQWLLFGVSRPEVRRLRRQAQQQIRQQSKRQSKRSGTKPAG